MKAKFWLEKFEYRNPKSETNKMSNKTIKYNQQESQRLDKFLVQELPDLSRAKIQKMIKSGLVLVNKKVVTPHVALAENDVISVKPLPKNKIKKTKLKPKIIVTAKDFLVLEKPAGLIVHPGNNVREETMTDLLLKDFPEISEAGEDESRPGIVHRLDKDVSGLMIIARNQDAFKHFKKQFQEHEVKKEYTALAHGELEKDEGIIDFTIERAKGSGRMAAKPKEAFGRQSETEFDVIERFKNYTLLKLKPKTGRTHQIRVHLKAIGHSIVGDQLYKTRKLKEKIELDRIFLHAGYLGFYDLKNKWQEHKSNLPIKLKNILKNL